MTVTKWKSLDIVTSSKVPYHTRTQTHMITEVYGKVACNPIYKAKQ